MKPWPSGKSFAFSVIDDTDNSTLSNVKPVYDFLHNLGILTTKTVWMYDAEPDSEYRKTETLQNPQYRNFVLGLQERGFEIAYHGARGCSSPREMNQRGLEEFKELFGHYPRMFANHAQNLDNLYWGDCFYPGWMRWLIKLRKTEKYNSEGHDPASPYFWGDLAKEKIKYVRGFNFNYLNTLKCNPYLPYHRPSAPLVNNWFSSSNAGHAREMVRILSKENIDQLVAEKGCSILYTHFGNPGFVDNNNELIPELKEAFTYLASRNGWFAPVSDILDHISEGKRRVIEVSQFIELFLNKRKDFHK